LADIKLKGNSDLLNFSKHKVLWRYKTSEHMFQALKATSQKDHDYVANASTAEEAKRRGRAIMLREDWESVKWPAMVACLILKMIAHPDVREQLVEGGWGGGTFIEWRNDPEWGGKNDGKNLMGKALQQTKVVILMGMKYGAPPPVIKKRKKRRRRDAPV
jgi:predicted NAD-dependent protein-ADP-ribosyltransferase YbiA (DUF1768 family)